MAHGVRHGAARTLYPRLGLGARLGIPARAGDGEGPKITREYREDDDTVLNNLDEMIGGTAKEQEAAAPSGSSQYVDELPEIPRTEMSDAMKEKLRREYYSLGGSPNKSMGSNYFLNIILVISALAILSAALGYL